jgi:hypothetical protein
MDHNGFYSSAPASTNFANGSELAYISLPNGSGGHSIIPHWVLTNNVTVNDAVTINADSAPSIALMQTHGVFPAWFTNNNVFFNFTKTGTDTCSNTVWTPQNPGHCPAGLASSPSTINTTLGIADYATCSTGDATPGSSTLSSCVITGGNYSNVGPDISKIIAAQAEPNDSTKWGVRTPN